MVTTAFTSAMTCNVEYALIMARAWRIQVLA